MARIRTIKPEFFTSEDIVELSPLARLFYIGLWCEADREGRLAWKAKTFKLRYLPADDCDLEALSAELTEAGLVEIYEVDGKQYAEIPSFTRHQVINNRESASEIPARVADACPRVKAEGKEGREGKEGKDASKDAKRGKPRKTSIPADFKISDRVKRWAAEKGHSRLDERLEHFVGKAKANGYTYTDWDEAFMAAVRDDWAKLPPPANSGANLRPLL